MLMNPFLMNIDFTSGSLNPSDRTHIRKLSNMKGMFADGESERRILGGNDPVIYSFSEKVLPEEPGHLQIAMTSIHPGKIGAEYYMTKGHYHKLAHTSEVYLGLAGRGCLLMQTVEGNFASIDILPGVLAYIPPYWGHRMVNTGEEPFIFFAVYPGDAGHNYGDIEKSGFAKILVERNGKPILLDNPRWQKG
jgi:glucose-6-phosphate isomerase, archaeal